MPVGYQFSWPENTVSDYERVCAALGFPAIWPDGLVAHACRDVDGSLVIQEVWETRDQWRRFMHEQHRAVAKTLGDDARPPAVVHEGDFRSYYARAFYARP
jgi:hypothetical protein